MGDWVEPSAEVIVAFQSADAPNNSITEAGIDDFSVEEVVCGDDCPTDVNSDGMTDFGDILEVLSAWGGIDADVDGDGTTGFSDLVRCCPRSVPADLIESMNFARAGSTIGRPGAVCPLSAGRCFGIYPSFVMSLRYHAACCQTGFVPEEAFRNPCRIDHMVQMMHHAVGGTSLSLMSGCWSSRSSPPLPTMSLADLREQLAVELPGDSLTPYIKACQELGCFVWTGTFLERDSNYPDAVFNTTCLVGPTGLLAKYRRSILGCPGKCMPLPMTSPTIRTILSQWWKPKSVDLGPPSVTTGCSPRPCVNWHSKVPKCWCG